MLGLSLGGDDSDEGEDFSPAGGTDEALDQTFALVNISFVV